MKPFITFGEIKVGEMFANSNHASHRIIYKKTTPSTGVAEQQFGYGNTRAVGGTFKFGHNALVWKVEIK